MKIAKRFGKYRGLPGSIRRRFKIGRFEYDLNRHFLDHFSYNNKEEFYVQPYIPVDLNKILDFADIYKLKVEIDPLNHSYHENTILIKFAV